ncbi:glycosyl hydrolase family 31 [Ceratocystis lukuohia]|uniref:alpha-glucosidase n=1 Tax=Ceratocystis lukuohia TaxID=2019550 RepID=A0ABR4MLC2_9PEZI
MIQYTLGMLYRVSMLSVPYFLGATSLWASLLHSQQSSTTNFSSSSSTSGPRVDSAPVSTESIWYAVPNVLDANAEDCQKECPGYEISNIVESSSSLTADLDLASDPCNIYGTDIPNLTLTVEYQDPDRLHVEIVPRYLGAENSTWFIIPEQLISKPAQGGGSKASSELEFIYETAPTFGYRIVRKATNTTLFSTSGSRLVFTDQFFEFVTELPPEYNLYGLGETIRDFRLGNNLTRTLWAADVADQVDQNLYGSHPVYLDTRYYALGSDVLVDTETRNLDTSIEYTSYTHGVFLRNVHGMDVLLRDSQLTWRSLGGSIDLYFYAGPTATDVIATYQKTTVGLPAQQQYWTFGYHQCRWGYTKLQDLEDVVQRMQAASIPLETIWSDIDYMEQYRDFTVSAGNFPADKFADFLDRLHARNQHYVPIIDAAIFRPNLSAETTYPPYERGAAKNAFLMTNNGSEYVGRVWPGYTVFPDFVGSSLGGDSQTTEWWTDEIRRFYDTIKFDGLWVDMNEVSSFCEGSCGTGKLNGVESTEAASNAKKGDPSGILRSQHLPTHQDAAAFLSADIDPDWRHSVPIPGRRNLDNPPYAINHIYGHLAKKSVAPSARHHVSTDAVQYDFHNLFGHQILNATWSAMIDIDSKKRPFIIGRSTFAGSGAISGHWGGDNFSLWKYLHLSIAQGLSFSIFGIPMFGTDACGFLSDTNEELCARWMQLNAFLPFFRNHNTHDAVAQEPYLWPGVAAATRTAMQVRYALLPYMYTLFWAAHTRGETVLRALAWEFPGEPWFASADRQFLLGSHLLVVPVLESGVSSVQAVLPDAVWYDWWNQTRVTSTRGASSVFAAPVGHTPLFVRGGSVIPLQQPANTTAAARMSPWELIIALNSDACAAGELYLDDGESITPATQKVVQIAVANGTITAKVQGTYVDTNPLACITVMGISEVTSVSFNGNAMSSSSWAFDKTAQLLKIDLKKATQKGAWASGWELVIT